ncbi:MAG: nitric oxide reductase transcriptional regulator NorR [Pseudomonas sp.]
MTTARAFADLAGLVADLSRTLPRTQRFERLLDVFRRNFPCDAIALLQREGGQLIPRAVQGLSPDTLGRRFVIREHPRLAQVLDSRTPVRFAADSAMPDPYDGLVENADDHLYVHDCMGAPLYVGGQPWGLITLDALHAGSFDSFDTDSFEAFVAVAAATVHAADWIHHLEEQLERRQKIELSQQSHGLSEELIGNSEPMRQLKREAGTVAASDLTVLILGETGVGKELVARYIHRHSGRAGEPMVYVNCAALPEAIAESELFGHVKGAFSGASENRAGKFELAHEGTLFLDEVGELPLAIQAKLLRALQDGEIQRVGSDSHHRADVRLIAATNRDLKTEVAEGRFRPDLYHRLSVYPLVVPPLRERGEDISLLAGYFLERDQRRLGLRGVRLSRRARTWLAAFPWPGNVRELEHALSRGIIRALSEGQDKTRVIELDTRHLGNDMLPAENKASLAMAAAATRGADVPLREAVDDFQRALVDQRLRECGGNKAAAAQSLGIDRGNLSRLLKRLGVE